MSNLAAVTDHLVDIADTADDVDAISSAIRFLDASRNAELTLEGLNAMLGDEIAESDLRSLFFAMSSADLVTDDGLATERVDTVVGAAKMSLSRGHHPTNDVVVNVPTGDERDIGQSLGSLVVRLVELIASTDEELVILNPFFTEQAFRNVVAPVAGALERDVSVTLVTRYLTYGSDDASRKFVEKLLSGRSDPSDGLTLYEYIDPDEDSTATIHTKMILADRKRAYLGTANLTHRGLRDNLEVGVIFRDDTVSQLAGFVDDLRDSDFLHRVVFDGTEFQRV